MLCLSGRVLLAIAVVTAACGHSRSPANEQTQSTGLVTGAGPVEPIGPTPVPLDPAGPLRPALEAGEPGPPVTVAFDWGVPCRVPVLQDADKNGHRSRIRFDLVVRPADDELLVTLEEVEFLSFDGVPIEESAIAGQVDQITAQIRAAMPSFRVSADGAYLGIDDYEPMRDMVLEMQAGTLDEAQRAQLRAYLDSPAFRTMVENASTKHWSSWVSAWVGRTFTPGQPLEAAEQVEVPGGEPFELVAIMRHHGRVAGRPDAVLLSATSTVDGEAARRIVLEQLRTMSAQLGQPPPDGAIDSIRRETVVTVAIEPSTGRPLRSRFEMTVEAGDLRKVELRDLAFDWARAEGCQPSP